MNAREELQRTEATVAQLRQEIATLQRHLVKPTTLRNWTLAGVLGAAVLGGGGFRLARHVMDGHAARTIGVDGTLYDLGRMRAETDTCKEASRDMTSDLASCTKERARRLLPALRPRPGPRCPCEPGDPLCVCP